MPENFEKWPAEYFDLNQESILAIMIDSIPDKEILISAEKRFAELKNKKGNQKLSDNIKKWTECHEFAKNLLRHEEIKEALQRLFPLLMKKIKDVKTDFFSSLESATFILDNASEVIDEPELSEFLKQAMILRLSYPFKRYTRQPEDVLKNIDPKILKKILETPISKTSHDFAREQIMKVLAKDVKRKETLEIADKFQKFGLLDLDKDSDIFEELTK